MMDRENNQEYMRIRKVILLIVIMIVAAGILGWLFGRSSNTSNTQIKNTTQSTNTSNTASDVKSLVSYVLPDGWKEASCSSSAGAVFVLPGGSTNVDCNASPISPVKISVDPSSSKDCNEIQNVQNVKKHVCTSLYINGHKSLRASTEYLASSSYGQATTINAYYIDTGKGVVKVEYVYNSDNQFQAGFDDLAKSTKDKS